MSHCQHRSHPQFCNCDQDVRLSDDIVTTLELQDDQTQDIYAAQVRQVFAWKHNCQQIFAVACVLSANPFAQVAVLHDIYWAGLQLQHQLLWYLLAMHLICSHSPSICSFYLRCYLIAEVQDIPRQLFPVVAAAAAPLAHHHQLWRPVQPSQCQQQLSLSLRQCHLHLD